MTELSEEISNFIEELSESTSIESDFFKKEYEKLYEALKDDDQFTSDELDQMIKRRFIAMYLNRSPAIPRQVIPIGMEQIKKNRDGDLYSSLYVIDNTKKLRRIVFKGPICDMLREIQLFYPYKDVPLAEYSNSDDFLADSRTDFSNLIDKKLDPMKVLSLTNAKKLTLNDILTSSESRLISEILTRVDDRGWPIHTDWRAIHGTIQRISTTEDEKENTNRGYMTIVDDSIQISKELFDSEGNKIRKSLRVWISPLIASSLTELSEAWILGILSQNPKTKEITMTGITIIPTYINTLEE